MVKIPDIIFNVRTINEGQTRFGSMIESTVNIVVGFIISIAANLLILPLFGFKCDMHQAMGIGALFTIVSFVRSYCLRRLFNWIMIIWRL